MKRSMLIASAVAACLALAGSLAWVRYTLIDSGRQVINAARSFAIALIVGPQIADVAQAPQARKLVAAKQFVQRIAQRKRPTIESTWRMCESV